MYGLWGFFSFSERCEGETFEQVSQEIWLSKSDISQEPAVLTESRILMEKRGREGTKSRAGASMPVNSHNGNNSWTICDQAAKFKTMMDL